MKTKLKNKGQGAMEYLMTYGWAMLMIVIVCVVLWQLGVFGGGTSDISEEKCSLVCKELYPDSIRFRIRLGCCECMSLSECKNFGNDTFCRNTQKWNGVYHFEDVILENDTLIQAPAYYWDYDKIME